MTEENKVEEAVVQQSDTSVPQGPELNLNDLASLKSIIDVASQRGAFKASEMAAVGTVYNKLATFLDTVTAKKE